MEMRDLLGFSPLLRCLLHTNPPFRQEEQHPDNHESGRNQRILRKAMVGTIGLITVTGHHAFKAPTHIIMTVRNPSSRECRQAKKGPFKTLSPKTEKTPKPPKP